VVNEPVLNTELAGYLARGLSRALQIPESAVRVVNVKTKGAKGRHRFPDIQIVDFFGVRIVVQGKVDNLAEAIEDCKQSITDGVAEACFAASYPADLAKVEDIREVRKKLETAEIDIALVKQPTQLTLEGWPADSIVSLGKQRAAELVTLLNGDAIYDEIVGSDAAERLAENIGEILNAAEQFPPNIQRTIATRLADALSIRFEGKEDEDDDAD
jgi:hypothetical protein